MAGPFTILSILFILASIILIVSFSWTIDNYNKQRCDGNSSVLTWNWIGIVVAIVTFIMACVLIYYSRIYEVDERALRDIRDI